MTTVQVQFTIDDLTRGEVIVTDLLHRHFVACAQTVGPVTSRYWWRGSLVQAEEWMFVCKTTRERLDEVVACIRAMHPYEVPEIVTCDIDGGLASYIDWIVTETQGPPNAARS
ncbi:MAG TPA: divalent-cation tolerance protein CutA [Acidimicrobiia bacterium]|nr:divalent-cation tolerance protein CutA [Acidimicrobiia bacterium]